MVLLYGLVYFNVSLFQMKDYLFLIVTKLILGKCLVLIFCISTFTVLHHSTSSVNYLNIYGHYPIKNQLTNKQRSNELFPFGPRKWRSAIVSNQYWWVLYWVTVPNEALFGYLIWQLTDWRKINYYYVR